MQVSLEELPQRLSHQWAVLVAQVRVLLAQGSKQAARQHGVADVGLALQAPLAPPERQQRQQHKQQSPEHEQQGEGGGVHQAR